MEKLWYKYSILYCRLAKRVFDMGHDEWFLDTLMGRYTAQKERCFFEHYLSGFSAGGVVVRMDGAWLWPSEKERSEFCQNVLAVPEDVAMAADAMAWESHSVDVLLLPHSHETAALPQVLHEVARVLKPEGRLILTGFNPKSLWLFSRWFDGVRLPEKRHCLTLPALKGLLADLDFEVEYGQFMVYLPAVDTQRGLRFWQFMEKAGDRWWPQCAAVYGLVLVKRMAGVHPLPEFEKVLGGGTVALGAARVSD